MMQRQTMDSWSRRAQRVVWLCCVALCSTVLLHCGDDASTDDGGGTSNTSGGDAAENCGDGVDNDADGAVDCDDTECSGSFACRFGDTSTGGTSTGGTSTGGTTGATGGPTAELCDDGVDNDGNGLIDCADVACLDDAACNPPIEEVCGDGVDNDNNGQIDCDDPFCADDPTCELGIEDCANGLDDDGDGLIDCDDADCLFAPSCQGADEDCSNAFDDDGDGLTDCDDDDCALDPACQQPDEEICDDGIDNDGNGDTDCADEACAQAPVCVGTPEVCNDGIDNDLDGDVDCLDADCVADPACQQPDEEVCNDGIDNDLDGDVDCVDPDCEDTPICQGGDACDQARPVSFGSFQGNTEFSSDNHAPSCVGVGNDDRESVWVWTPEESAVACINTVGTDMDTIVFIRTACDDAFSEVECNDDIAQGTVQSQIELNVEAGESYWIFVDGYDSSGPFQLNIEPGACTQGPEDEVCDDEIDNDLDGDTDCDDDDCSFDPACAPRDEDCSNGVDDDGDGFTDCNDADCEGQPICTGNSTCQVASELSLPGSTTGSTFLASNEHTPSCVDAGVDDSEEAWTLSVEEPTTVCVHTFGSEFDTILYVRSDCEDELSEVACNDDAQGTTRSQVEFTANPGTLYTVFVDGYESNGAYTLSATLGPCRDVVDVESACDDGLDDDQDGFVDCNDTDCDDDPACVEPSDQCVEPPVAEVGTQSGVLGIQSNEARGSCSSLVSGIEDVWSFSTTARSPITVCADTFGSELDDSVLFVRTACADESSEIVCNDDAGGFFTSQVEFVAQPATTYWIFVEGYDGGSVGAYDLNIQEGPCP